MGHRALVAYERYDGTYTVHYSHWGGATLALKHRITAETPFGGEDGDAEWAQELIADITAGLDGDAVTGYLADHQQPSTPVEPDPIVTGVTLEAILAEQLDYLQHEAFFVVSSTFEVTAYRTLWFGLQCDCETIEVSETVGNGALATVRWHGDEPVGDGHLQGQFQALKDITGDLLDDGVFSEPQATQYLREKLGEWVGDQRELLVALADT